MSRHLKLLWAALALLAATPVCALTPEEARIKHWFDLFAAGQRELMIDASCSQKAGPAALLEILTGGRGTWINTLAARFDVSRLKFMLLSRNGDIAYVRVTGQLGEPKSVLRPGLDWVSYTDKTRRRGYSDIVVAVYQRGDWRHCDQLTLDQAREYVAATPEAGKGIQDMGEYDLALEVFPAGRAQAIIGAWVTNGKARPEHMMSGLPSISAEQQDERLALEIRITRGGIAVFRGLRSCAARRPASRPEGPACLPARHSARRCVARALLAGC